MSTKIIANPKVKNGSAKVFQKRIKTDQFHKVEHIHLFQFNIAVRR